jgi:hypothetical protein
MYKESGAIHRKTFAKFKTIGLAVMIVIDAGNYVQQKYEKESAHCRKK